MPTDPTAFLLGLVNLPDLILLALLLLQTVIGFRRGFFRTLCGFAGKLAALAAALFAARQLSPFAARVVVTPIVGELFEKQASLGAASGLLDGLRQTVTEAAVSMAESIAFLLLLILFAVLFGWLAAAIGKSLHFIAHLTPLGVLDSLAGGLAGLAAGLVLAALVLIGISWVSPITYTPLGWLSPERVAGTELLRRLIDVLPIVI